MAFVSSSLPSSIETTPYTVLRELEVGSETGVGDISRPGLGSTSATAVAGGKAVKQPRTAEYYFAEVISSNGDVTYRMHLRDGSVVTEKLNTEGLQFSIETLPDLRQEILDRLQTLIHLLEASHGQSPPDSAGYWYKGSFRQTKVFLAREITGIIVRRNLKDFSVAVGYDVWDQEL
jgi:hypothetical protein